MVQVNEQRINVRFVVKLNNPQMGTEAEFLSVFLLIKKC